MTKLERFVTCDIKEDGSFEFKNMSPWLRSYIAHLASVHNLPQKTVMERCFVEGVALALVEETEKGRSEVVKRDLSDKSEKPVVVFGRKSV